MRLRERYRRLTLFNKLALWGSLASVASLILGFALWAFPRPSSGTPRNAAEQQAIAEELEDIKRAYEAHSRLMRADMDRLWQAVTKGEKSPHSNGGAERGIAVGVDDSLARLLATIDRLPDSPAKGALKADVGILQQAIKNFRGGDGSAENVAEAQAQLDKLDSDFAKYQWTVCGGSVELWCASCTALPGELCCVSCSEAT